MSMFDRFSSLLFGSIPNRSPGMEYKSPFLLSWNLGAMATILVPILLFVILPRGGGREGEGRNYWWSRNNGNDNNNGNQNNNNNNGDSWWQRLFNIGEEGGGPEQQGMSLGGQLFIYLYVMLIFAGIVWYGNRILRRGAFTLPLLAAMCIFMNLAFLMAILTGVPQGDERRREEGMDGIRVLVAMTLGCMAIFTFVFFLLIRCRDHEYGVKYERQLDPDYEEDDPQNSRQPDSGEQSYSYNRERKLAAANSHSASLFA